MPALKQILRRIPYWAFLLVLIAIYVNTVYIIYRGQMPRGGETVKFENGYYIFDFVKPGSSVEKAGIRIGDTLVSMNAFSIEEWEAGSFSPKVGDTVVSGILRNNQEIKLPVIIGSVRSYAPGFFWSIYIIMIFFSAGSLYFLYKKPDDKAVRLFFIYIQGFILTANAQHLDFPDPFGKLANLAFIFFGTFFLSPTLIHFHLLFPRPLKILSRYKYLPLVFYIPAAMIAVGISSSFIYDWIKGVFFSASTSFFNHIALWWLTFSFVLALAIAIYQYINIRDTLSRNQLRIVIIGAFFSCITPMSLALFYDPINALSRKYLYVEPLSQGLGGIIMIGCILIAIFRFRIWDMEIIIRKALLYLGATLVITSTYLLLLYLVDQLTISETGITRFIILAVSVILFLVLRDWLQRLIDRLFHREYYDSATVVSGFEEKLAGIYRDDELKSGIGKSLDEIFHFKSLIFNMKIEGQDYEPVFVLDGDQRAIAGRFGIGNEFDLMLRKSKVFSPGELEKNPPVVEMINGELIVPLLNEDQPFGFFICGPKQAEKTYSLQDIRVLSLIAKRVIALFHTANLYRKDLDRQLMLERERARISQDMHDDVGASLTRISILSELAKNNDATAGETKQWLGQISDTSRNVMEEMSQIIWALNPKNDTLEGLVSYLRRFVFEYLEPTTVRCAFDIPDSLPDKALSVEVRRNVYLVVRETLHNIVKHSGASEVTVSLHLHERRFTICVKDNGHGFNPDTLAFPGNGLNNMKKRITDIGGEFQLISKDGEGTEVRLIVPA
jgi:signal transduction histidine kinase